MHDALIVGLGDPNRGDDGVAAHVVNAVRLELGMDPLPPDCTGLESVGQPVDSILVIQLVPELADVLAGYRRIAFVDAHVLDDAPDLLCTRLTPERGSSALMHHVTPQALLALCELLHGHAPRACLVSARGHDFGFHEGLSVATSALIAPAVACILDWLREPPGSVAAETE